LKGRTLRKFSSRLPKTNAMNGSKPMIAARIRTNGKPLSMRGSKNMADPQERRTKAR